MWNRVRQAASSLGSRVGGGGRGRGRRASESVDATAWNPSGWWWCMDHQRAENPPDVPGNRRLGPYDSASDAENWRERLDRRNEEWDESDRRWAGD